MSDGISGCDSRPSQSLLAALAIGLRATPAHALSACATSILACCKITAAGTYNVTSIGALSVTGGDCIDITVPGVVLNLNNHDLHQQSPATGIGIHVLSTAPGTIVNGGADISITDGSQGLIKNFKVGVQNDAPRSFIYAFESKLNTNGVVDNASNATFFSFLANNNTGSGVTINSPLPPAAPTSNVRMLTLGASHNGGNGVKVVGVTGADLEHFSAFTNLQDGVQVVGGSGNLLSKFSAGTTATPGSGNTGWGVTLSSTGSNSLVEGETSLNGDGGIRIMRSNSNRLSRMQSLSNVGEAGFWLDSSSQNTFNDFRSCGNATSGVYVGCSASTEPDGTSCGTSPHSNGNVIANAYVLSNQVGVGIDLTNGTNRVMSIDTVDPIASTPCSSANTTDLEDKNTNCGSNFWTLDVFVTSSPAPGPTSCIQ